VGITLHDLVALYAGVARGGDVAPPLWRAVASPAGPAIRLMEPAAAWQLADVLRGAPPPPNAAGNAIAFKTGTSYGYRDAWAVGFDRRHTVGVWVGRADNGAVPGLIGRLVAAPILFDAFARIGMEPGLPPRPENAIVATTSALPPPLRHLKADAPKVLAALQRPDLRVAFPPDGARLDVDAMQVDGRPLVQLKAQGGQAPFTWLVDGVPLGPAGQRRTAEWSPQGRGFARITLIDATGAAESVAVRLQ
jgi:penicillin-binding protein 1C